MNWEQQKAKELYDKFLNVVVSEAKDRNEQAKRYAIITAKELREETKENELHILGGKTHHRVIYQEKWNNVIKEIEKL